MEFRPVRRVEFQAAGRALRYEESAMPVCGTYLSHLMGLHGCGSPTAPGSASIAGSAPVATS